MRILLFLGLFILLARGAGQVTTGVITSATLNGKLLGIDGKPVADRIIHVVGISRGAAGYNSQMDWLGGGENLQLDYDKPLWNTRSDHNGQFSFQFLDRGAHDITGPGWGTYAILAEASPHDAGAVSTRFIWNPGQPFVDDTRPATEWPPAIPFEGPIWNLTMRLKKGFTLKGRVWDYAHPNRPFTGLEIMINNDLYAETHTGAGAEIFFQRAMVDRNGRFEFEHCYPVKTYVWPQLPPFSKAGSIVPEWLQTKINGKWIMEVECPIQPPTPTAVIDLQIRVNTSLLFHYYGQVTDAEGKPLPNVSISGGAYKTQQDGTYSFYSNSPTIRWLSFDLSGFDEVNIPNSDSGVPQGENNVVLQHK